MLEGTRVVVDDELTEKRGQGRDEGKKPKRGSELYLKTICYGIDSVRQGHEGAAETIEYSICTYVRILCYLALEGILFQIKHYQSCQFSMVE